MADRVVLNKSGGNTFLFSNVSSIIGRIEYLEQTTLSHIIENIEYLSIIKIVYFDEVTLEDRMNIVDELSRDFINSRCPKILIDARELSTEMTETEQQIWGKYIASREGHVNASVAVIYQIGNEHNQPSLERAQREGHKIETFYTEAEAIKWLSEQN
jgi:hypothetical protein